MFKMLFRLVLTAIAFMFVLPHLGGIEFHGGFMHAMLVGLVFSLICSAVDQLAIVAAGGLLVTVPILGFLGLIGLFVMGYWLVPTFGLLWLAAAIPHTLSVGGFWAAAMGGLVMSLVGVVGHIFT